MSEIFLVDLRHGLTDFEVYNNFARDLVNFALNSDKGVFFLDGSYYIDLINEAGIKNYFLMSNSFLYKNCDFLSTEDIDFSDYEKAKEQFLKKFAFLESMLDIVNAYGIEKIDIYVSEGGVESLDCFEEVESSKGQLLHTLYDSIIENANEFALGFPNLKVVLNLQ